MSAFLTVDLTRTGRRDLALLDSSDDSLVVVPVGDAGPGKSSIYRPGGRLLRTGDFDGDGLPDLLIVRNTSVQVFFSQGDGTLRPGPVTDLGFSLGLYSDVAVGDFDGDGWADLAISDRLSKSFRLLRGSGQGGFVPLDPVSLPSDTSVSGKILAGDFNGDGKIDLLFPSGGLREYGALLLGDGKGGFGATEIDTGPVWVARVADADGDGIDDVIFCHQLGGPAIDTSIWFGGRTGPFSSRTSLYPYSPAYSLAAADFDGDGHLEVVFSTYDTTFVQRIVGRASIPLQSFAGQTSPIAAAGRNARPGLVMAGRAGVDLIPNLCGSDRPDIVLPPLVSLDGVLGVHFESQLTLANRGLEPLTLDIAYSETRGSGTGHGSFTLPPGQRTFPSAFDFLRSIGIPIPAGEALAGSVGIRFTSPRADLAALVRTTASAPGSPGKGGVAESGVPVSQAITGGAWIPWLREDAENRSNAAFIHAGSVSDGDLSLRLSVVPSAPAGAVAFSSHDLTLHPGEFQQVDRVLAAIAPGVTRGFLRIETAAGTAPYLAWGVVNDNGSGDGSSVPAVADIRRAVWRGALVVPAIVETGRYSTELVVTNLSAAPRTVTATFRSELVTTASGSVTFTLTVPPSGQIDVPDFVQSLRDTGVSGVPPRGRDLAAALFLSAGDGDATTLLAGARITDSIQGSLYGVYVPAVPVSASTDEAWLFGLRQDDEVRTNLAIVNTGDTPMNASIDLYDGPTGKLVTPPLPAVAIDPGRWIQLNQVLRTISPPLSGAYARITAAGKPFLAYAVINDGSDPNRGTGDGSYVAMQSW